MKTLTRDIPVPAIVFSLLASFSGSAQRMAGGGTHSSAPASQIATFMAYSDPTVNLISLAHPWRYDQSGADLGSAWKETGFDDGGWPEGPGVLAYENHAVVNPLTQTVLSLTGATGQRVITYYFRTRFTFADDAASAYLSFSNLVDDGAVVYLNGEELFRQNMPGGAVAATTLASSAAPDGVFSVRNVFPTNLWLGENLLAVEVHQQAASSSDVVFGLALKSVPVNWGPPLIREGPRSLAVRAGAPALFQVSAVGQPALAYQWQHNGAEIPNATNADLALPAVWAADLGQYRVLVSNGFGSVTSSPAWLSPAELDLQVVSISRTPRFPRYDPRYTTYTVTEPSGFGPYTFTAATSLGSGQTANTQRWPAPGSPVAYTATVRNRGGDPWTGAIRGAWWWDGALAEEPELPGPLPAGGTLVFSLVRTWDGLSHEVRFGLLSSDARAMNDSLAIDTKSVAFLSYIDQSYYESFRVTTAGYPNATTDDLIDWINLHMARFNQMFADAACAKRVHYDVLEVIPDEAPDPGIERLPFAIFPFRFRAAEVPSSYRNSGWYNRAQDIDYGYLHEMAHQLGLIDIYQLDISSSANQVSGVGYTAVDDLMRACSPFLSPASALPMNHWVDQAHGYYGQYLYGIPSEMRLRLLGHDGQPLAGATVKLYQVCDRPGMGKVISTQIKGQGTTDIDGLWTLPNVPVDPAKVPPLQTGDVLRANPFGYVAVVGRNGVLHFRVEYEGGVDYAWLDITEANVAYYQGQTNQAIFERRVALGGPKQIIPPPELSEMNAADWIPWAEGSDAGGTYVTNDTQLRRVGTASLKFVTDGGFDTYLRYPGSFAAQWDLSGVSALNIRFYAENPHSFQNGSPWIRLQDAEGNFFHYQYYRGGNPVDILNTARGTWWSTQIPLRASDTVNDGWRRTVFGTPELSRIQALEIHADTWDYGFTLWIDGLSFVPLLRPSLSIVRHGDAVLLSWPTAFGFALQAAADLTGPFTNLGVDAISEPDGTTWVVIPAPDQRRFFRLAAE